MGDQGSGSTMVEIAAARALQWNVDFDRGLRSAKPGAQCEAVMKLGPQLVRWSQNCGVTASSANLFKLEPGQDRVFANAILLRLAETFRSGNNFIRTCILKVLLLEFNGRGCGGETFTTDGFERISVRKNSTRTVRRIRSGEDGLLTKKRIANHVEILRRIKSVLDSGDPTSRALALRVLGCLADFGKDSVDVHNLVLQAVYSPHFLEVSAAFFAMGCLSELSDEFAGHSLQKAFEMVSVMRTPPQVKVLAVRLFSKMGHSPVLSLQAHEMGRKLMLRYPIHEIVTTMLISLTMLASECSVIMGTQVNLLLTYLGSDPRMNVRAIALKSLGKLVPQALCCLNNGDEIFNRVFAVVQDTALPPPLHVLSLQIIRKLYHQRITKPDFSHLLQIMSWMELTVLCGVQTVVLQALSILVDMAIGFAKLKMNETSEHKAQLMNFSTRICFLLCDQVSIAGGYAVRSRESVLRQPACRSGKVDGEQMSMTKLTVPTTSMLLVRLVKGYPLAGWNVVDSVARIMETLARGCIEQLKEDVSQEGEKMEVDDETKIQEKDAGRVVEESAAVTSESVKAHRLQNYEVELILTELGRCLSACVSFLQYKMKNMEVVHERLLQLTSILMSVDTPPRLLRPLLQALVKVNLAHESLTAMPNAGVAKVSEVEKSLHSEKWEGERCTLFVESRRTIQGIIIKLREGGNFWMVYEIGKQAALCGLWRLAESPFESLADKVSSEGCYFWLQALSYHAKAEGVLQASHQVHSDTSKKVEEQMDDSMHTAVSSENEPVRSRETVSAAISQPVGAQQTAEVEESILGRLGQAAASAMPLLRNAISSLSAGVCLEQRFEFQRWFLMLRVELLDCASELVGLLACVSSFDTDAAVIDLEDEGNNNDMKSLGSALMASMEKVEVLASRLRKLSDEYDFLSISFMGIDQRSIELLSRAALFCSLLTFCSVGVLSPQNTNSQLFADSALDVGAVALDLFHRLQQIESREWDDLLSFAIQNGAGLMSGRGLGGTLVTGTQDVALANLSRWAITSVLGLQKQHSLVGVVRGTNLLQQILLESLHLPWLCPPFFFCTRLRTGVDLFLTQAGPRIGETDDLSVVHGSALALSVCLQIVNPLLDSCLSLKKLVCALSVEPVESSSNLDPGVCVGSKAGSMGNHHFVLPSLIEKLFLHSKVPNTSNLSLGGPNATTFLHDRKEHAPDLFFSVVVGANNQGFASCTLDVSRVPCGQYQLTLSCICLDSNNGKWILPLLSTRPVFRIT